MSSDTPTRKARSRRSSHAFCGDCGTRIDGTRFCPSCGAAAAAQDSDPTITLPDVLVSLPTQRVDSPPAAEAPLVGVGSPPAEALPPVFAEVDERDREHSHTTLVIALISVIVLLIVAGGAALVLMRGGSKDSFAPEARSALAPVVTANATLAKAITSLTPTSSTARARLATTGAKNATRTAQATLATLTAKSAADKALASNAQLAMTSELAWLSAAAAVLHDPSSPMVSQLGSLRLDTTAKLQALGAAAPAAGTQFPSSTRLVDYANAQTKAAQTTSAVKGFIGRVDTLLTQSAPSYTQINQLFGELSSAANGNGTNISLAQAEQTISSVVANRSALAASARALTAPTSAAHRVQTALVASMDASLSDDQAIDSCLNQNNFGDVAYVFSGCLNATASQSSAATTAKNQFWSQYNALRRQVGESSTHVSF